MTWKLTNEIGRKAIHLTILVVIFFYAYLEHTFSQQIGLMALVGILMLFLFLEYLRLEHNWKIPYFHKYIRAKEQNRFVGIIYFLSGTIIALAVFDFPIAIAALLMATFGDLSAAIIGKKYGRSLLYRNKTVKGTIAELIINLIVGFIVLSTFNFYIPIAMALTATFVETFVDELDDNLLVPLFCGFTGQILISVL